MKRVLFYLVFQVSVFVSNAQTLTLHELIDKSNCGDFNCINESISNRGFCFLNSKKKINSTLYTFESCFENGTRSDFIFTKYDNNTSSSSIGTGSASYVRNLLSQLKQMGFKAVKTDDSKAQVTLVTYQSPIYSRLIIELLTSQTDTRESKSQYFRLTCKR